MRRLSEEEVARCHAQVAQWIDLAKEDAQAAERCRKAGYNQTISSPDGHNDLQMAVGKFCVDLTSFFKTMKPEPREAYVLAQVFDEVPQELFIDMPAKKFFPKNKMVSARDVYMALKSHNKHIENSNKLKQEAWEAAQSRYFCAFRDRH